MPGNKPEFYLRLVSKDRTKKRYSNVGVAWTNEFGFAIQLNPGVVLDWRVMDEFYINLVPNRPTKEGQDYQEQPDPIDMGFSGDRELDDDIPF